MGEGEGTCAARNENREGNHEWMKYQSDAKTGERKPDRDRIEEGGGGSYLSLWLRFPGKRGRQQGEIEWKKEWGGVTKQMFGEG